MFVTPCGCYFLFARRHTWHREASRLRARRLPSGRAPRRPVGTLWGPCRDLASRATATATATAGPWMPTRGAARLGHLEGHQHRTRTMKGEPTRSHHCGHRPSPQVTPLRRPLPGHRFPRAGIHHVQPGSPQGPRCPRALGRRQEWGRHTPPKPLCVPRDAMSLQKTSTQGLEKKASRSVGK